VLVSFADCRDVLGNLNAPERRIFYFYCTSKLPEARVLACLFHTNRIVGASLIDTYFPVAAANRYISVVQRRLQAPFNIRAELTSDISVFVRSLTIGGRSK